MTAVKRSLTIEKGAAFKLNLRLKDKVSGDYQDLSDYEGRMQVRAAVGDEDVALDITDADFTFDDQGRCRIFVGATRTQELEIAVGVYDLEIYPSSNAEDVTRLFEGPVKVKTNVTRPVGVAP